MKPWTIGCHSGNQRRALVTLKASREVTPVTEWLGCGMPTPTERTSNSGDLTRVRPAHRDRSVNQDRPIRREGHIQRRLVVYALSRAELRRDVGRWV